MSPWRYLPHVVVVTLATVVLPLAVVELTQSLAGIRSVALAIPLAIGLSVAVATVGSSLWKRRPGARDMLFGDLMLVGFARRLWTERNLAEARRIVGDARNSIERGGEAPPRVVQVQTLERLARALDARDPYTHGHSQRVAQNAHLIASRMGLPAGEVAKVRVAAAVHDAGKINTAREILNKPGRLTDEEFDVIKRHPTDGAEMIAPLRDPEIVAMVRHHHERLDGSGYPDGLAGEDIPVGARIIAVADTFDAITSVRPYRSPRKQQAALQILKEEAGERLDADAVAVFLTYYAGRRTAAWSSLALAVPERLAAFLTGGAGPIAQGVAATVATVGLTAAIAGPVIHPEPPAPRTATADHLLAAEVDADASRVAGRTAARVAQPAPHERQRAASRQRSGSTGEASPGAATTTSPAGSHSTEAATAPVSQLRIGGSGWVPESSTGSIPGDSGSGNSGSGNSGSGNSGSGKSGSGDFGSGNSGSDDSGEGQSGSGDSGSGDSGSGNSGSENSGPGNSGSGNSGSGNSGSGNSGSGNLGSGNSGSGSSGSGGNSGSSGSGSGGGLTDLIGTLLNPVLSPILGHHH